MTTPATNDIQAAVPFMTRMRAEGLPDIAIRTFAYYYWQLNSGETGIIAESDIEAIDTLPDAEKLPVGLEKVGSDALRHTILLKLNGGLGTGMGLEKAKSLLPVKNGLTFLDIIAKQAEHANIPLVLMNSFATRDDSLAALNAYPNLHGDIPLDFVQHKIPKIIQDDLSPAEWDENPALAWCPPGHGDIYPALISSGMLDTLLAANYKYAFVSNADNLGAVLDKRILGYFAQNDYPFMMEAADRTAADRKGGHLARRADGQLLLRESAQCAPKDADFFQDITRHKYFNTNNLWINLPALKEKMRQQEGILGLPMICNAKTIDPRDPDSPAVFQLETAMGSAIAVFENAAAIRVPRTRFAPVKSTDDLLAVRSDAYHITPDFRVTLAPARKGKPVVVKLDGAHFKLINQLDAHFPHGAPSLIHCNHLTVTGNVVFGKNISVQGDVRVENRHTDPLLLADNLVLE